MITSFKVSSDKSNLLLELTDASTATNLYIWTDKTYKKLNDRIDLSDKLNGSASQSITISLAELNLTEFDGLYFIELVLPSETHAAIAEELTKYEECLIKKANSLSSSNKCFDENRTELINIHTILYSLRASIKHGFIQEMLNQLKALQKFCDNKCQNCGKYKNIVSNDYFTFNINNE